MGHPVRYLFDQAFSLDDAGAPERETVDAEEARAQLESARKEAFEAGRAAGRAEAAAKAEQHLARSVDQMMTRFAKVVGDADAAADAAEEASVELAILSARKLARTLIAREPLEELMTLMRSTLGDLRGVPHVIVRVNADLADMLDQRVGRIARESGIEGRIIVMGEPDIEIGDGRIEWADGGAIRRIAQIERGIDAALASHFGLSGRDGADDMQDPDDAADLPVSDMVTET